MTTIQTSYPVFESGQVLSSGHLNDLVDYLEQQDRLTRTRLIGIGIVCGLEPSLAAADRIKLTAGCAVTSKGYLIVEENDCEFDRTLSYTVPVPSLEEIAGGAVVDDDPLAGIELRELVKVDSEVPPGEAATALDATLIANTKLLLYLECNLESLKNCDINDCSDKGAEMDFTLRRLLISKASADALLAREQAEPGVDTPVARSAHLRYDLDALHVEKINPAAKPMSTFEDYFRRILDIANSHVEPIVRMLKLGYEAYEHFLSDMYPTERFGDGPFGNEGFPELVFTRFAENIFLAQYFYDYLRDVTQSHNEFIVEAARLDAECCPSESRFPKHILVGELATAPTAAAATVAPGDAATFDPLSLQSDFGPDTRPSPYRHHFIPSMLHDRGSERLERLRSLHYRTYLLAYRFDRRVPEDASAPEDARDLEDADIRITPSKEADHALSEKAIPFYYRFATEDDLHRNWSHAKTTANALESVYSYQYSTEPDHSLTARLDDHDFHRIEGIVGKTLGTVLDELIRQKRELGLSFGIEPVYIGISSGQDAESRLVNQTALASAASAMRKLLVCRMGDLDVVFLILMATLFYYLYYILSQLASVNLSWFGVRDDGAPEAIAMPRRFALIDLERNVTDRALVDLRKATYVKGTVTSEIMSGADPGNDEKVGGFYAQIKDTSTVTGLYDRMIEVAAQLDFEIADEVVTTQLYPIVSLIDKTELLLETVTAASLAEFDFDAFDAQYAALARAFDGVVTMDVSSSNPELVVAQVKVAAIHGSITASGPQAVISSLSTEFQDRLRAIFEELVLEGYAQRHPGLVHKAGAPNGGTIVLLYAHRASLIESVNAQRAEVETAIGDSLGEHARQGWSFGIGAAEEMLGPAGSADEALDQFVVVADFCVPYLCCDADCSEIDLTTEIEIEAPVDDDPVVDDPVVDDPVVDDPVVDDPVVDDPVIDDPVVDDPVVDDRSTDRATVTIRLVFRDTAVENATVILTDGTRRQRTATHTRKGAYVATDVVVGANIVTVTGLPRGAPDIEKEIDVTAPESEHEFNLARR